MCEYCGGQELLWPLHLASAAGSKSALVGLSSTLSLLSSSPPQSWKSTILLAADVGGGKGDESFAENIQL
jgi:hypothetical protein